MNPVKKHILLLSIFIPFFSFSQVISNRQIVSFKSTETFTVNNYLPPFFKNNYSLKLITLNKNKFSEFYIYEVTKNNKKINGCIVSLITDKENKALVSFVIPDSSANFIVTERPFDYWKNKYNIWYPVKETINTSGNDKYISFSDISESVHFENEDVRIYSKKDSWVSLKIFTPDPLSLAGKNYQYPYTDRKDSTYPQIENEKQWKKALLTYSNDTFFLKDDYISFAEITSPFTPIPVFKNDFISATRNSSDFEFINAFFHLQNVRIFWTAMGLSYIADTVVVDPHALGGSDESSFDRTKKPPVIEFGDGGVDDAEDADAIIHEYTHAACESIVKGGYSGLERKSVEEGICDFSAAVYSMKFTANFKGEIYNWDGHNEYWEGRTLVNSRKYPADKTGQAHIDGQLFGGALWDIGTLIGYDSCLKLVFLSLPAILPNIGMKEAAEAIIKTDSVLFNGRNFGVLDLVFSNRGLWQSKLSTHQPLNSKKTTIQAFFDANQQLIQIRNSGMSGHFQIMDYTGRMLYSGIANSGITNINLRLSNGIYILRFKDQSLHLQVFY